MNSSPQITNPTSFNYKKYINTTNAFAVILIVIIGMMILPIPSFLVDLGLVLSFAIAVLIFVNTLFINKALEFSSFPTLLLTSLILRLSLNISSTKLIIGEGHTGLDAAGTVIQSFANFVVAGNLLLGIVVFAVLMIINFIVITKGAGRMAEVGARFALDGMPGRQLAIDSDLASGAITHEEASKRRKMEQEETAFYGSLDGASKFVKGDAVAGLLIIAINLTIGILVGILNQNMSILSALRTYSILTIGDGLVTQIPAVIISIATAILLAKGGSNQSSDQTILKEIKAYPNAMYTVAILLGIFALLPGLPFIPFAIGASLMGYFAYTNEQSLLKDEKAKESVDIKSSKKTEEFNNLIADLIEMDEIKIEFSPDLIYFMADSSTGIIPKINIMRKTIAQEFGFILPEIRIVDNYNLKANTYQIKIQGAVMTKGKIKPNEYLALIKENAPFPFLGESVKEPVYGAPAKWISKIDSEEAKIMGFTVVSSLEVVSTHLLECIKNNLSELVNYNSINNLLEEFTNTSNPKKSEHNKKVLDYFIPNLVSKDLLSHVFRILLGEHVSIRNIPLILETIAESKKLVSDPEIISEMVRKRLSLQITNNLIDDEGCLPLIKISQDWENLLKEHEIKDSNGNTLDIGLPLSSLNELVKNLSDTLNKLSEEGRFPAVVVPANRRKYIRSLLVAKNIKNPVLSFDEISPKVKPILLSVV